MFNRFSLRRARNAGAASPLVRASAVSIEALESRTLLAATVLPAGFEYNVIVTGIKESTSMEFAPDGRLFYTQKNGSVRVVKNGQLLDTPLITIPVDGYF